MKKSIKKVFEVLPSKENEQRIRVAAMALALLLITGLPVKTYAMFTEWDDETKDMAWTVYTTTQWADLGLIYATSDGSIAMANVSDDFRETYGPVLDEVLAETTRTSFYPITDYKEILLAIIYTLNQEGNTLFEQEEVDICYWHKYMSTTGYKPSTVKNSISFVVNRFLSYENLYNSYHDDMVDIFTGDDRLAAVIQSVIFASGYMRENATYTPESARDYAGANADAIADDAEGWETFANEVLSRYSSIASTAHTTIG